MEIYIYILYIYIYIHRYIICNNLKKLLKQPKTLTCYICCLVILNLNISLIYICIYIYIYIYIGLIGRDSGLITLCHSCGFAFQQRVLKTLLSGWGSLTMAFIDKVVYISVKAIRKPIYIIFTFRYSFIRPIYGQCLYYITLRTTENTLLLFGSS